jgi:hypothetical protein
MPTETTARTQPPSDATDERAYQAFCEALSSSKRGRLFLTEYTRRNRNADTEQLLAAIEKLQSLVGAPALRQPSDSIKQDLRSLLDEIAASQRELEARILVTRAEKLAELIALVERRITSMLERLAAEPAPAVEASTPPENVTSEPVDEPERAHLMVVPVPEQPELPIPSPASIQPPSISLVHSGAVIAEVAFVGTSPPPSGAPETVATRVPDVAPTPPVEATPKTALPPTDPLASIKALSEDERLALFT